MNLSLPLMLVFLACLLVVAHWRRPYLFFIWAVVLLLLPTTRTVLGGAPIYWFDIAGSVLLATLYANHELRRWPWRVPKWHGWFVGVGLILGTLVPILIYRTAVLEMTWTWVHTSLAWMAFLIGVAPYISRRGAEYQTALGAGILAAILVSAAGAALQFGNAEVSAALNKFYFSDHAAGKQLRELYIKEYYTTRVNGPHGDPNTFGGKAVIMAIASAWLLRRHSAKWVYAGFIGAAVIVLATVSRQCLLAAAFGGTVILLLSHSRVRAHALVIGGVCAVVALVAGFSGNWSERLGRFEGGVEQDIGWIARLVLGPERLLHAIAENPRILITGVGLDVQKLVEKGVDLGGQDFGFVSNGFLLPLFYLGMIGFLLTLAFWMWTARAAAGLPGTLRATGLGSVAALLVLIAADNYSFLNETVVAMLFLVGGIMAGERFGRRGAARTAQVAAQFRALRRRAPQPAVRPPHAPGYSGARTRG